MITIFKSLISCISLMIILNSGATELDIKLVEQYYGADLSYELNDNNDYYDTALTGSHIFKKVIEHNGHIFPSSQFLLGIEEQIKAQVEIKIDLDSSPFWGVVSTEFEHDQKFKEAFYLVRKNDLNKDLIGKKFMNKIDDQCVSIVIDHFKQQYSFSENISAEEINIYYSLLVSGHEFAHTLMDKFQFDLKLSNEGKISNRFMEEFWEEFNSDQMITFSEYQAEKTGIDFMLGYISTDSKNYEEFKIKSLITLEVMSFKRFNTLPDESHAGALLANNLYIDKLKNNEIDFSEQSRSISINNLYSEIERLEYLSDLEKGDFFKKLINQSNMSAEGNSENKVIDKFRYIFPQLKLYLEENK